MDTGGQEPGPRSLALPLALAAVAMILLGWALVASQSGGRGARGYREYPHCASSFPLRRRRSVRPGIPYSHSNPTPVHRGRGNRPSHYANSYGTYGHIWYAQHKS